MSKLKQTITEKDLQIISDNTIGWETYNYPKEPFCKIHLTSMSWWDSSLPSYIWESASSKTANIPQTDLLLALLSVFEHVFPRLLVLYPKNTHYQFNDRLANKRMSWSAVRANMPNMNVPILWHIPDLNHPATKFVLEPSIHSLDICPLFVATVFSRSKWSSYNAGFCSQFFFQFYVPARIDIDNGYMSQWLTALPDNRAS